MTKIKVQFTEENIKFLNENNISISKIVNMLIDENKKNKKSLFYRLSCLG